VCCRARASVQATPWAGVCTLARRVCFLFLLFSASFLFWRDGLRALMFRLAISAVGMA